jgi:hypothetical protein
MHICMTSISKCMMGSNPQELHFFQTCINIHIVMRFELAFRPVVYICVHFVAEINVKAQITLQQVFGELRKLECMYIHMDGYKVYLLLNVVNIARPHHLFRIIFQ